MSKLSTPAISITDSVITISNIDSNATGIGLRKNGQEYKTLYIINDDNSYQNISASDHVGLMANDEQVAISLTANTGYELPESISVSNATGTYTKSTDTTGTLVLSAANGPISFTANGVAAYSITVDYNTIECSVSANYPTKILAGKTASMTFTAKSNYVLPDTISVTGAEADWNSSTGFLNIYNPTDAVSIAVDCLGEYSISDTVANCSKASGNVAKIIESKTVELFYTFDGTTYKCPPTGTNISIEGASGYWTYVSDTSGKITLFNATGNVSYTISGIEVPQGYTVTIQSMGGSSSNRLNMTASSGAVQASTEGDYSNIQSIDTISTSEDYYNIYKVTSSTTTTMTLPYTVSADTVVTISTWCVIGETPILLPDNNYKMIKDIQIGDEIASVHPETGDRITGIVTGIKKGQSTELVHMILANGSSIKMTPTHPVLTSTGYKTYVGYGTDDTKLQVGDRVVGNEEYVLIEKLNYYTTEPTDVYALDVKLPNGDIYEGDLEDNAKTIWLPYLTGEISSESAAIHTG